MNQREIKFKAFGKETKRFLGTFTPLDTDFVMPQFCEDVDWFQFTGLKDKNGKGKEVYEGDLIRACPKGYEPRWIYEVVWDEERLEWGIKSKIGMITSLWTFDKDFEVIGSIHENPELLK